MFLPGAIQAATGMIISYPFDTIKSKMQKNPKVFNTTYNTIKKTFIKEGFKGFYRGIPIPLSVIVIKRGFQYDLYEKLNKKNFNTYIIGGLSGGLGSVIGCPMHYVKINMQIHERKTYTNTLQFIKKTLKDDGIRKFYHGIKIDFLKESTFGCLYLGTYGYLRKNTPQTSLYHFICGGISSIITWGMLFPIDSLRTEIMTNSNNNVLDTLKTKIKNNSLKSLWCGITPILIRIFPVSAISMMTYEYTRKLIGDI